MKIRLVSCFFLVTWIVPLSLADIPALAVEAGRPTRDFASANAIAANSIKIAQQIKQEIDRGIRENWPKQDVDQLKLDYSNELKKAAQYFQLAVSLARRDDDKESVRTAWLYYAYVMFWQRKNYEAAVLAEHVARMSDKDDSTVALDAAYLSMAAFVQAFTDNKSPIYQKVEDTQLITKACNRIAERWPSSEKAIEAYMIMGRVYTQLKKSEDAAYWFGKVPQSDPRFPEAQINAGQGFWTTYLNSARVAGPEEKSPEQLAAWMKAAKNHLRIGIDALSAKIPKDAAPSELIAAKMSLAQILISQGNDTEASKLLLDQPNSVIEAVNVPDETERPEAGVTSRRFAVECYKLLLRAYLGTGNFVKARETIQRLDSVIVAGGEIGTARTTMEGLLVEINDRVESEIERLRKIGEIERSEALKRSLEMWKRDCGELKRNELPAAN